MTDRNSCQHNYAVEPKSGIGFCRSCGQTERKERPRTFTEQQLQNGFAAVEGHTLSCPHCKNITVCVVCGKGYAEAMRSSTRVTIAPMGMSFDAQGKLQQGEHGTRTPPVAGADLLEAVDTLLETAPCDCSDKRRYEDGEHLSGCYLFDLNIARGRMTASPRYWCNKCGYRGSDQVSHQRPNGTGECGYIARLSDGVNTPDGEQA